MQVIAKRLLESKQTTTHLYLSKGLYSFTAHVIFMMFDVIDIMIGVALFSDVVLDPLLAFRSELKGVLFISFYLVFSESDKKRAFFSHESFFVAEQHGIKVSVNDIIIKAVAIALRNVPEANGNS